MGGSGGAGGGVRNDGGSASSGGSSSIFSNCSSLAAAAGDDARAEEERGEHEADDDGDPGLARRVVLEEFPRPADLHGDRAHGAKRHEIEPAAIQRHGDQPEVQQGDVAEEPEGIVLSGVDEDGREKTAEDA